MSNNRIFSFILTSLLVMSFSSLCFGDDCNYSKLVDENGAIFMPPVDAGCAPDCPEDTVIRFNVFTHQFSCSTDTERKPDSFVVRKISPVTTTSTYTY